MVKSEDSIELYTLNQEKFFEIDKGLKRVREVDNGLAILPSSILLSIVASFDSIIGDFCKGILHLNPGKLDSSQRNISYAELFEIKDISQAKDKIINDEIDRFLRGSHLEQAEYLEKIINTKIVKDL